jgi:hypothetical protein
MAMRDPLDRVERATRRLAETDEPGWVDLPGPIMSRVRSLVIPSKPVAIYSPEGDAVHDDRGSRTWVSGRVLTTALRRALQHPAYAPSNLTLELDGDRCTRVAVELIASYGQDLNNIAQHARATAQDVVADVLGPDPDGPVPIDVELADIIEGDPRLL